MADARVSLRQETAADYSTIDDLVASAFNREEVPVLVRRIRASENYVPELSLVAERANEVVGHVMLSYVNVSDGDLTHRVLTLSPLSVLPSAQRQGIGGTLVEGAVAKADARGESLVILEGSPLYYPRFGFRPAKDFGISVRLPEGVPHEAAMVRPLASYDAQIRGQLVYPPAFDVVNEDRM